MLSFQAWTFPIYVLLLSSELVLSYFFIPQIIYCYYSFINQRLFKFNNIFIIFFAQNSPLHLSFSISGHFSFLLPQIHPLILRRIKLCRKTMTVDFLYILFYPHSQKWFCLGPQLIVILFKHIVNIILPCFAFHITIEKLV